MPGTPEQDTDSFLDELRSAEERFERRAPAEVPDPVVLESARALAADPGGPRARDEVYRLLSMTRYVATRAGAGVAHEVVEALRAAADAVQAPPCHHTTHPFEHALRTEGEDEVRLAAAGPEEPGNAEEYRCPHTVAMFARIAAEIIAPGTVEGIPDLVPEYHESRIGDLAAVLHGYPHSSDPQYDLTTGIPDSPTGATLAGHIVLIRAACWHVASGTIRQRWVFDDTIQALRDALALLDGASCTHADGEHPALADDPETDAAIGYHLLTPGGRARLRQEYEDGVQDAPPAAWLCPVLLRDLAREAHGPLTEARERFFGERHTDHLDAACLRADGELAVAEIAARLVSSPQNERSADDLALWAARRRARGTGDTRERLFLLLAGIRALDMAYPDPPPSVYREVRPLLQDVLAGPLPVSCPHRSDHPGTGDGLGDAVGAHLAHLCDPDAFPAPEGAYPFDAWACPRNLAPAADKLLEWTQRWDKAAEEE